MVDYKISKERIAHCHGVAEFMYGNAKRFHCNNLTPEDLYILGYLHDIGYINGKTSHEDNGATLMQHISNNQRASLFERCIRYHGHTPKEYMDSQMCTDMEIPNELILLWYANMSVESSGEHAGEIVGFEKRLDGIKNRLGEDSLAYKTCCKTINWLRMAGYTDTLWERNMRTVVNMIKGI